MTEKVKPSDPELTRITEEVAPDSVTGGGTGGLNARDVINEAPVEQRVDSIEMIGEENAAGMSPPQPSEVTAGMRYLHCSRTIHQLVTDRNRAVGVYLAIATLLWTASTALLNAKPTADLIIPIDAIQRWCLPMTFGIMTILAVLVALLLVRTRVGLIYEVAKMNVLLGLPLGRVKRINPLSIFFLMHLIISLAGAVSAGLFSAFLLPLTGVPIDKVAIPGSVIGVVVGILLVVLYICTVLATTSEKKLQDGVQK